MLRREVFEEKAANFLPVEYFCITCRVSMYIHAVAEGLLRDIGYLAEGARLSQGYPEQNGAVLEMIKRFVESYGLKLLLPILSMASKEAVKEELALRGIIPKTREPYCVMSMPLYRYELSRDRLDEILELMDSFIIPKARVLVDRLLGVKRSREMGVLA